MKIAIHQPQYMPWSGYLHKMASVDLFIFLDDVQFKKNEWQHRNRIRNAQGWQWLSVPNHYRFPERINEVEIERGSGWKEQHMKSITACYGKAPWFSEFQERTSEFFNEEHSTLDTLNISSVNLCASFIGITTPVDRSSKYLFEGVSTERLVSMCKHFGADTYLAGAGGHDYMDLTLFKDAGISVEFQQFTPPVYPQHWARSESDFVPGLSSLDLIFNCGPKSNSILMGTL